MAKFNLGDKVKVWRYRMPIANGVVTKAGRRWCEVHVDNMSMRDPFDMETGKTRNAQYSTAPRIYTLDEWNARQRERLAQPFLAGQGIRLEHDSPWAAEGLAHVLREARGYNVAIGSWPEGLDY